MGYAGFGFGGDWQIIMRLVANNAFAVEHNPAGDRAIELRDDLRQRGVLVRDRSYELAGCLRVTVGTRDQIRRFLDELEQIW